MPPFGDRPVRLSAASLGALACAWLLLAAAGDAHAQATDATRAFVEDLVGAINSKSLQRRRALLHPASLACARPELLDEVFARQAGRTVPTAYRWTATSVPTMMCQRFCPGDISRPTIA